MDKKFSDKITVVKYSCEIVYCCLYGYAAEIFFNLHVFNLFVKLGYETNGLLFARSS